MSYIRKSYTKEDIKQGHIIELINKNKDIDHYLVLETCCVRSSMIKTYEKYLLLKENGDVESLDKFKDDLSRGDKVLYRVFGGLMYRKIKSQNIDIFNTKYREQIYQKDVIFLSKKEKELFEMLLSKVDKCIIFA